MLTAGCTDGESIHLYFIEVLRCFRIHNNNLLRLTFVTNGGATIGISRLSGLKY